MKLRRPAEERGLVDGARHSSRPADWIICIIITTKADWQNEAKLLG